MKKIRRIILVAVLTLCACAAAKPQEPPVVWFDDFLGGALHPGYITSLSPLGAVKMSDSPGVGGAVMLAVSGSGSGVARLRFGEEPVTGMADVRNFSARKNLVYKARVFFNRNTDIQATIGLVGYRDPDNVLALILGTNELGPDWQFQAVNDKKSIYLPTGFVHTPGEWFTVRIETVWGEAPIARVYFNDEEKPRVEIIGEYVPASGLCPEFQLWNRQMGAEYSQPTMWVDYLSVKQDR